MCAYRFLSRSCAALVLALGALAGPARAQEVEDARISYEVTVEIGGENGDLERRVRDASNLIALEDQPVDSPEGLILRARTDPARIASSLYGEARYGAVVTITAAGRSVMDDAAARAVAQAARTGTVPVVITVDPGPLFRFGSIRVTSASGTPLPVAVNLGELGLVTGEPARSGTIIAAERRIVEQLRADGRPLAQGAGRDVVADHRTATLDVAITVDPATRAGFGPVQVSGTQRMRPDAVSRQAGFTEGEIYDPKKLEEYRARLVELGVFGSVRIREGDSLTPDGLLPITVEVDERPLRYVGFSAGYSTTDGAALGAYWGHRNLFGGAEGLRLEAEVSRLAANAWDDLEYKAGATFTKPGVFGPRDDLNASAWALREAPDAYTRVAVTGAASIRRKLTDHLSVQAGVELERSRIDDAFGRSNYLLAGIPLGLIYDSTDSRLDPTEGFRANATVTPFPVATGSQPGMTIARGQISAYQALDASRRFVVAGRLAVGATAFAELDEVPANRRFFAGGGGSVRGYGYKEISPRAADGALLGGRSLLEGSLELRYKLNDRIGIVPFVDAGAAFDRSFPDFSEELRYAAGLGVRYYTAVGPLRADIAVPLNRRKGESRFGVYISLGQSF